MDKKSTRKNTSKRTVSERPSNTEFMSSKQSIEKMKYEIASELGVRMGPDTSSKENGAVGGEITKRLVKLGENQLGSRRKSN